MNVIHSMRKLPLLLAGAALLCAGALPCRATPVLWGPAGVSATNGYLDATLIPASTGATPIRYTNVNNQGYDIVVTTSGLGGQGYTPFLGDGGWWFQGTAPGSSQYAIITLRFYATGTNTPVGINGTDIVIQDAENQELFGGFSYFDHSGNQIPVLFDDAIFAYSYGADYFLNYDEVSENALQQSGSQVGKSMEINMASQTISGFTFGVYRQTPGAGSVIMMGLGNLSVAP